MEEEQKKVVSADKQIVNLNRQILIPNQSQEEEYYSYDLINFNET